METLFKNVARLSWLCASVAKALIGLSIIMVIADVTVRNMGMRPMTWAISATEYSLLYITFLSMPWLVRTRGHVFVVFLRSTFSPSLQRVLEIGVYLLCLILCIYLGFVALGSLSSALATGSFESRTFDMPKWLILLPIVIGFFLSALEWLAFLLTPASLYTVSAEDLEGL